MVTIEPAPEDPVSSTSTSSSGESSRNHSEEAHNERRHKDEQISDSGHRNNEDDTWETASEGEDDHHDDHKSKSAISHESFEDALTEEQQKQKLLLQANTFKSEGNMLYAARKYEEALMCYGNALDIAPDDESSSEIRSMCYCNSAVCHLQLNQYDSAVEQSTKAVELNSSYLKAYMRRAQGHEKLDHLEEALADYKKVLELDPANRQAKESARRLEPIVEERREKLKEEMLGKLKDLGNSVLGRFGMSVDNFKAVKDPNTGSYSISFQR